MLTFKSPIPQTGQTHSNSSSANCLSVFDHFLQNPYGRLVLFILAYLILLQLYSDELISHFILFLSIFVEFEIG